MQGFGESTLLDSQVLQVYQITRELFCYAAKHFGALPSRLFAALAKQNKRSVSSRKARGETTWRKKSAIPFTIVSKKNYEIFLERAKQEEYFSEKGV